MPRSKRRKAAGKPKSLKRGPRKMHRASGGTAGAPVLASAIANMQAAHAQLLVQRTELDAQIAALDAALATMGAAGARAVAPRVGRPPGRPAATGFRSGSLKDYIARVLQGRGVMAVKDITDAVQRFGYKSKNKTLAKSVGIALTEMPSVSKVGRGKFRMA